MVGVRSLVEPLFRCVFQYLVLLAVVLTVAACTGHQQHHTGDSADRQHGAMTDHEQSEGAPCSEPSDCRSGLCVNNICASECAAAADCADGWDCRDGICWPPHCASDADCASGQYCGVVPDGDRLATVCRLDADASGPGANCRHHDDCRGGYCLDETCTAPCEDDSHCGPNQVCGRTAVSLEGAEANLQMCSPLGVQGCSSPRDCERDDMTCNAPTYGTDGEIDGVSCGYTNPDQSPVGATCRSSAECQTDLCLPATDSDAGECSVVCEDSRRDCADSQVCTPTDRGFGFCSRSCSRHADCQGADVCTVGADDQGQPVHYCDMPYGDRATGETCETDEDCASAFCLTSVVEYEGECVGDEQCPDGARCGCSPLDPNCSQHVCYIEQNVCTEPCDPARGDADCQEGDHDLEWCDENVEVETETGPTSTPACAPRL